MSISFLLVALALGDIQHDVLLQPGVFMNDTVVSRDAGVALAASGNPWAAPLPDADYPLDSKQGRPPASAQQTRPRYISPDELKSLEKLPQENKLHRQDWQPRNMNGLFRGKRYGGPLYDGTGYPGSGGYGYPRGGGYGYPAYPGLDPLLDPYGGSPYGDVPYQGLSPFIH